MTIMLDDFKFRALSEGYKATAIDPDYEAYADYVANGGTDSAGQWIEAQRKSRPHVFEIATDGNEPALFSVDAQAAYITANGAAALSQLLASNGLKIGQVKKPEPQDQSKIKGETNPYSPQFRGTEEERAARINSIIVGLGTKTASAMAKSAGKTIANQPLRR